MHTCSFPIISSFVWFNDLVNVGKLLGRSSQYFSWPLQLNIKSCAITLLEMNEFHSAI